MIHIERPKGRPVRPQISGGSARVELDGQVLGNKGGATTIQSVDWTGRGDRIAVELIGGAKSIGVVAR